MLQQQLQAQRLGELHTCEPAINPLDRAGQGNTSRNSVHRHSFIHSNHNHSSRHNFGHSYNSSSSRIRVRMRRHSNTRIHSYSHSYCNSPGMHTASAAAG